MKKQLKEELLGFYEFNNGRPFIRQLVQKHTNGKPYLRRVYGFLKECERCKKVFFTSKPYVRFCTISCSHKRENNPMWSGGRFISGGYVILNIEGKRKQEHRIVMESYLGRELKTFEIVHHKNAIKTDNRIENLELIIQYPKTGFHKGELCCPKCNFKFFIK